MALKLVLLSNNAVENILKWLQKFDTNIKKNLIKLSEEQKNPQNEFSNQKFRVMFFKEQQAQGKP